MDATSGQAQYGIITLRTPYVDCRSLLLPCHLERLDPISMWKNGPKHLQVAQKAVLFIYL